MSVFGTYKVSGIPVPVTPMTTGNVFFVDSGNVDGSDNPEAGKKPNIPFSTIDYAIGQCTANNGDYIYVMPGHVEDFGDTSAGGYIDVDVAGISIIGLGRGSDQPRLDFNHADSDFIIDADNVLIENIRFSATVTIVKIGVSVLTLATDVTLRGCRFDVETTATDEFLITINAGVGCDRLIVEDCLIDMGLGGAATGIKLVGATAGATFRRNRIVGDYSLACIGGLTTASTEVYIEDNMLTNGGSGNVGAVAVISMVANTTGVVRRNTWLCNLATIVLESVADTMFFSENYAGEDVGAATSSVLRSGAVSVTASADD